MSRSLIFWCWTSDIYLSSPTNSFSSFSSLDSSWLLVFKLVFQSSRSLIADFWLSTVLFNELFCLLTFVNSRWSFSNVSSFVFCWSSNFFIFIVNSLTFSFWISNSFFRELISLSIFPLLFILSLFFKDTFFKFLSWFSRWSILLRYVFSFSSHSDCSTHLSSSNRKMLSSCCSTLSSK